MAAQPFEDDDEKPLDPAVEQVQRRLRRLMLISGLTLGLGIFAVFLAIIYRLATGENRASAEPGTAVLQVVEVTIPAGARLLSVASAGERIVLAYDHAGGSTLILVDPSTLAVVGRLELKPQ